MQKRRKLGIRETILVSFALFTIIALGGVAITTGIFVQIMGSNAVTQTTQVLEAQVKADMQNKTADYSQVLQAQFGQAAKDLDSVAQAVANAFSSDFQYGYRKAYCHVDALPNGTYLFNVTPLTTDTSYPENVPPDVGPNPKIVSQPASANYSDYLVYYDTYQTMVSTYGPGACSPIGEILQFNNTYGDLINRTNTLDPLFRDILANNPAAAWIYTDYQLGIQRTFPWSEADTTIFGQTASDRNDYKTWAYYENAKAANGKVVWTYPEIDPYIGWFVSASRALYNGTTFIGCVGMDFRLDVINQTIGNIKLFNSGYGFLINKTGAIISHPKVVFNPDAVVPDQISDVETFVTPSILAAMTSGQTGYAAVTKDGAPYYLAYSPVPLTDNNYTLGVLVPQAEVLATVTALQNTILFSLGVQLGIIFAVLGAILVVALYVGLKTANSVVRPIHKLTQLAQELSTEDVKKTATEKLGADFDREVSAQDEEIGNLAKSFRNLVKIVQEESSPDTKRDDPKEKSG